MGLKGYESSIPVGMLFRKMKCCKCGFDLSKKAVYTVSSNSDGDLINTTMITPGGLSKTKIYGITEVKKAKYLYKCENCNYLISYEHQNIVSKYQKQHKKRILTQEEQDSLGVCFRA